MNTIRSLFFALSLVFVVSNPCTAETPAASPTVKPTPPQSVGESSEHSEDSSNGDELMGDSKTRSDETVVDESWDDMAEEPEDSAD